MPVRGFTQVGKDGKALQQTAVSAKSGVKNVGRDFGTFGKETFRRRSGAVKCITVQVNERKHGTVLILNDYVNVCGKHGQNVKKGVYFNQNRGEVYRHVGVISQNAVFFGR